MKLKRTALMLCMACGICSAAFSANDYREETFRYYISREIGRWQEVIDSMLRIGRPTKGEQLELLEYYYGLVGYYLDQDKKQDASATLKKANALLDRLRQLYPEDPVLQAYKSNFIGFEIALNPVKAPLLFRGMLSHAKTAYKKGKEEALVNLLYGNILFYMPELFGGDCEKALLCYEKALEAYDLHPEWQRNNWLYLQLITSIALVNEQLGRYQEAQQRYLSILSKEPNHVYVSRKLYPRLLAKMKG